MAKEKEAPKKLSRKEFVKGAAVGGAGVAAAGVLASCAPAATPAPAPTCPAAPTCPPAAECAPCPTPWIPENWDEEADVVVLGHGFAAQAAAIEADRAGASVIMLEKAPEEYAGGNSRVCGQGIIYPPERVWDDYFTYLKFATTGQGFPVNPDEAFGDETLRFYIEESSNNWDWFEGLGATLQTSTEAGRPLGTYHPFYPHFPGADALGTQEAYFRVGGEYLDIGYGMNWYFLEDCIKERPGIRTVYETPAKRLVQDPVTKVILGVVAESGGSEIYIKAKRGVCVCAGGWEFNPQMTRDFQGVPVLHSPGGPYNTGETIQMCWEAGADLRNMSVIAAPAHLRSVGIKPGYKSTLALDLPDAGACIAVGANNKRFYDEYRLRVQGIANKEKAGLEGTWGYTGQIIENGVYVRDKWPMPMHMIFDEEARLSGPLFSGSFATRIEGYECSADNSAELADGWITKADSVSELATKLGREPDPLFGKGPLGETIERWNGFCAAGWDQDFDKRDPNYAAYGRPPELLNPIPMEGEPIYAVEVFPRCLNTQGGMLRNTKSQVLNRSGQPIPRLYAGGENGDIWTWIYQCMSNVGGGCFGYGRVAGQNAAAEQPWDEA